jgi:hypothetical protein
MKHSRLRGYIATPATRRSKAILGRFYLLTTDQLVFIETFVRCEGKINKVEEEMGISYPTVRNRLNEVIRSMGYEVREDATPNTEQRKVILEQLATGQISSDEAIKMLRVKP